MDEQKILHVLEKVGAVITGSHIVYTSGKHGSAYVNKDAVFARPKETAAICRSIAEQFLTANVEVVIGPAIGAAILSQWVAYYLNEFTGGHVLAVYAEKELVPLGEAAGSPVGDRFVVKRGYDKLLPGKRVLVVEDVLTTGGSAKKVVEVVRALGGKVVGLGVLVNRGGITRGDVGDVPNLFALVNTSLESWEGAACPLCASGVPVNTDVGKGREFLKCQKV